MKKSIHTEKAKRIVKVVLVLVVFLIVQLIMIFFFKASFTRTYATEYNVEEITFVPQRVDWIKSGVYRIYLNEEHYYTFLPKYCSKYYGGNFDEKLSQKKLTISYLVNDDINNIVALKTDETVYLTVDDYNAYESSQKYFAVIFIVVCEFFYLLVLFASLTVTFIDLSIHRSRRRPRIK